jgi:hypothetical protein
VRDRNFAGADALRCRLRPPLRLRSFNEELAMTNADTPSGDAADATSREGGKSEERMDSPAPAGTNWSAWDSWRDSRNAAGTSVCSGLSRCPAVPRPPGSSWSGPGGHKPGLLVQCPKTAPMDDLKGTGKSLRARHLMVIWCWGGGRWDRVAQNRAATSSPTPRAACRNLLALSVRVHA